MAEDAAAEIEALLGRVDAGEIWRVEAALERRRRELGLSEKANREEAVAVSELVEYRSYEDGLLQAERRRYGRKDGAQTERGPYWYFKYHEGGRRRSIYLGKTEDPEAALQAKREANS